MERSDVSELHYITLISNVSSIMKYGIVSHRLAQQLEHVSVAMSEIQGIRTNKTVPGGRPLYDYANLYFDARNPMLYKRKDLHKELCVLQVNASVLDLPKVVITDGNAASGYTAFWPSPAGLARLNKELIFAEYWKDEDQIREWCKKRTKCAEVLVPDRC